MAVNYDGPRKTTDLLLHSKYNIVTNDLNALVTFVYVQYVFCLFVCLFACQIRGLQDFGPRLLFTHIVKCFQLLIENASDLG